MVVEDQCEEERLMECRNRQGEVWFYSRSEERRGSRRSTVVVALQVSYGEGEGVRTYGADTTRRTRGRCPRVQDGGERQDQKVGRSRPSTRWARLGATARNEASQSCVALMRSEAAAKRPSSNTPSTILSAP